MAKVLGIINRISFSILVLYSATFAGIYFARELLEEAVYECMDVTPWAASSFVDGLLAFTAVMIIGTVILGVYTTCDPTKKKPRDL